MRTRNTVVITGIAAILALASTVSGRAIAISPSSHVNHVTFSQPVSLPGVTLPAGTYDFELGPAGTHRDIVRVSSQGGQPYFMGFTREVPRPRTLRTNQVMEFGETRPGAPAPIAVWYPLNAPSGHAFVYR